MTPATKIVAIVAAVIILALGTTATIFFFMFKAESKKYTEASEKIVTLEKDVKMLQDTNKMKDEQLAIKDDLADATYDAQEAIKALEMESRKKQATINNLIEKIRDKEASGEYDYTKCPDTTDVIDTINFITKKRHLNEETNK